MIPKTEIRHLLEAAWKSYGNLDSLIYSVRQSVVGNASKRKHVVIDFSSPNIAKPFHFGHLKSTILGDWGTQYGLVSLGFDKFGDENKLKDNPLRHLLDVYVKASNLAKENDSFYNLAKNKFLLLDKAANENQLSQWEKFRNLSLSELKLSYEELGIQFDAYNFESDYRVHAREVVHLLDERGLLKHEENGAKLIEVIRNNRRFLSPVLKSDGATLYLTRDIAAAIDRQQKYNFDEMLYVVGQEQEHHMKCMFDSIRQLNLDWHTRLKHIETGKVFGMSTRAGEFVLLKDILEEVTQRYIESTRNTPTSKLVHNKDIQDTSRHLALSALFVYDMRNPRRKSYSFEWDAVLVASPRSGLAMQAAYARLSSLKVTFPEIEPQVADPEAIACVEGEKLLTYLSQFADVLKISDKNMDPSPLIQYAFELCTCSNRALQSKHLRIRGQVKDVASTRLALFSCVHNVLGTIIKLLGLKPLERI